MPNQIKYTLSGLRAVLRVLLLVLHCAAGGVGVGVIFAQQPTTVVRQPDCLRNVGMSTTGQGTWFDNRQSGCSVWVFYYNTSNATAVDVTVQSAGTDASNIGPDLFSTVPFAGTTTAGVNPNTAVAYGSWQGVGYFPWVSVKLNTLSGSTPRYLSGVLYGWKTGSGSGGGGSGGYVPSLVPTYTRYQLTSEVVLAGTSETTTVQATATSDPAYFEDINVYCTSNFVVQLKQNGTAATTTALTVTGINGASITNAPLGFNGSNVGTGTTLRKFYGVAGQTYNLLSGIFYLAASAGTSKNLSVQITTSSGTTCNTSFQWRKEF